MAPQRVPVQGESTSQRDNDLPTVDPAVIAIGERVDRLTSDAVADILDAPLFAKHERFRRRQSKYCDALRGLHDLNIAMPIVVPSGKIVVDDPGGQNYYEFDSCYPGAQLLFGRPSASAQTPDGAEERPEGEIPRDESPTAEGASPSAGGARTEAESSACDTWATFLNVRLGTVFNVRPDQIHLVCQVFREAFAEQRCSFSSPVAMECKGVFPCVDSSIGGCTGNSRRSATHAMPRSEKYETHARLATEADRGRFRAIRRGLKVFASRLAEELGAPPEALTSPSNPASPCAIASAIGMGRGSRVHISNSLLVEETRSLNRQAEPFGGGPPMVSLQLHENCRAAGSNTMRLMIREWGPIRDRDLLRLIWTGQPAPRASRLPLGIADQLPGAAMQGAPRHSKIELSCRVVANEIRLEHTNLRVVDPRWPSQLVLGRRLADGNPLGDASVFAQPGSPTAEAQTTARVELCETAVSIPVRYNFDPVDQRLLFRGRRGILYFRHLQRHPNAAGNDGLDVDAVAELIRTAACGESPGAAPSSPPTAPTTGDEGPAEAETVSPEDVKRNSAITEAAIRSATSVVCKFYGRPEGCARGNACHFRHGAAPKSPRRATAEADERPGVTPKAAPTTAAAEERPGGVLEVPNAEEEAAPVAPPPPPQEAVVEAA